MTAGASAPEVLVERVVERLRSYGPVELSVLPGAVEDMNFRLPPALAER